MASYKLTSPEGRWLDELAHGDADTRAFAALGLSGLAREHEEYDRAATLLQTVLHEGHPVAAPRAAFALAQIYSDELLEPHKAELAYRTAAALAKADVVPDVVCNLAARWTVQGRTDSAVEAYRAIVEAAHLRLSGELGLEVGPVAAYRLGHLLSETGDGPGAEAAWRWAIETGDDEAAPHSALALAEMLSGKPDRAQDVDALLGFALSVDHPDCSPDAAYRMAVRAQDAGLRSRALELYRRVAASQHHDFAQRAQQAVKTLVDDHVSGYLQIVLERQYMLGTAAAQMATTGKGSLDTQPDDPQGYKRPKPDVSGRVGLDLIDKDPPTPRLVLARQLLLVAHPGEQTADDFLRNDARRLGRRASGDVCPYALFATTGESAAELARIRVERAPFLRYGYPTRVPLARITITHGAGAGLRLLDLRDQPDSALLSLHRSGQQPGSPEWNRLCSRLDHEPLVGLLVSISDGTTGVVVDLHALTALLAEGLVEIHCDEAVYGPPMGLARLRSPHLRLADWVRGAAITGDRLTNALRVARNGLRVGHPSAEEKIPANPPPVSDAAPLSAGMTQPRLLPRAPMTNRLDDSRMGLEERRFLQLASALVCDAWNKRLQNLPSGVGDYAYDHALDTIIRRALKGVTGFRDDRGDLSPIRVKAYVQYVVDRKLSSAWQVDSTVALDAQGVPANAEDVLDLSARLACDRAADEWLTQARRKLEAFERLARENDARRMRSVAAQLAEHGVAGVGAEVVMRRAARELTIVVGERGLEIRYSPATGFREIAEQLDISDLYARKLSSRILHKLPPMVIALITDPMGSQQPQHPDAGPDDTERAI